MLIFRNDDHLQTMNLVESEPAKSAWSEATSTRMSQARVSPLSVIEYLAYKIQAVLPTRSTA